MSETLVEYRAADFAHLLVEHRFHLTKGFAQHVIPMAINIYSNPDRRNGRTWKEVLHHCIGGVILEHAAADAFGYELLPFGGVEMADLLDPVTGMKFDVKSDHDNGWWCFEAHHMTQVRLAAKLGRTNFVLTGTYDISNVDEGKYADVRYKMVLDAKTIKRFSKVSERAEEKKKDYLFYNHHFAMNDGLCVHRR